MEVHVIIPVQKRCNRIGIVGSIRASQTQYELFCLKRCSHLSSIDAAAYHLLDLFER